MNKKNYKKLIIYLIKFNNNIKIFQLTKIRKSVDFILINVPIRVFAMKIQAFVNVLMNFGEIFANIKIKLLSKIRQSQY